MTCQTWLKNLKKLKRTWMPRRSPLVHEARSSTAPRTSLLAGLRHPVNQKPVSYSSVSAFAPPRAAFTHAQGPPVKNYPHVSNALTTSLPPASPPGRSRGWNCGAR